MKNFLKILIISILSIIIFYFFNITFFQIIGTFMFWGNSATISYHMFTYTGIMTLCAVIISCTYIIIQKLNDLNK